MKLHRITTVSFDSSPQRTSRVTAQFGDVLVEITPVTFNKNPDQRLLVIATIELAEIPEIDNDGFVIVPEASRKSCEQSIEHVANYFAVIGRTSRRISSATPWVAFSDVSEEAKTKLNATKGFRPSFKAQCSASAPIDLANPKLASAVSDRSDGLALLAEALSNSHPVGRYREILRFFENAFARPLPSIEKKLFQFLSGANLGYSRAEVKCWIEPRNASVHGDLKKNAHLVMEPEIRPLIPRLEQAAYDVLFNKAEWHSNACDRRDVLRHEVATTNGMAQDLMLTQGRGARLSYQVSDPFGSYPLDLTAILSSPPANWWWKS